MTAVQTYHSPSIKFEKYDFQSLIDILIDGIHHPTEYNPVVEFLSNKTGYELDAVDSCFRYVRYFGEYNKMPFTKVLRNSNPGADFWFQLYSLYDLELVDNGCKRMLEKTLSLL